MSVCTGHGGRGPCPQSDVLPDIHIAIELKQPVREAAAVCAAACSSRAGLGRNRTGDAEAAKEVGDETATPTSTPHLPTLLDTGFLNICTLRSCQRGTTLRICSMLRKVGLLPICAISSACSALSFLEGMNSATIGMLSS